MTHNGIYATPNQVVANKNRKTNFDIMCEDIIHYNSFKSSLFDQAREDLKQYCIDIIGHPFYSYIDIIDIKYDEHAVIITELTSNKYTLTHEIPKAWYENRKEYIKNLKY